MVKSLSKKFPPTILALVFLLTTIQPREALSQENQASQQNVLRQASLKWMQVGMQQYQSKQFTDAEQSFRRAFVFQKYLTDAERNQLNEFLAKTRTAATEGIKAAGVTQTVDESVEQDQPAKEAANKENVETGQPAIETERQQIKKMLDKINDQPARQNVKPVIMAEPRVSKIQLAAESSSGISDIVVTKNDSFKSKYMQLSDWLSENRRNILIIGLPILAILILISKFQARKRRPGKRVYENPAIASSTFIGARLTAGKGNKRKNNYPKVQGSIHATVVNPKRKSFTQSTEHWKKNAVK